MICSASLSAEAPFACSMTRWNAREVHMPHMMGKAMCVEYYGNGAKSAWRKPRAGWLRQALIREPVDAEEARRGTAVSQRTAGPEAISARTGSEPRVPRMLPRQPILATARPAARAAHRHSSPRRRASLSLSIGAVHWAVARSVAERSPKCHACSPSPAPLSLALPRSLPAVALLYPTTRAPCADAPFTSRVVRVQTACRYSPASTCERWVPKLLAAQTVRKPR